MNRPIRSIGIIMDGNRRWANERGLSPLEGHRAGLDRLRELSKDFERIREKYGTRFVTLYAFSTENWNRSSDEVAHLMTLFESGMREILRAHTEGKDAPRVRVIGERDRFSPSLKNLFTEVEERTATNNGGVITFALSYGGRSELVEAINRAIEKGEPIDENKFEALLWSGDIPDPDIIIRTGGEKRLSNFLLWKSAYAELFFPNIFWPDFTTADLERICEEYYTRERRHGT